MKKKQWITLVSSLLLAVVTVMTAFAGGWKQDSTGWWYQREDGSYPNNGWEWIDGNGDNISECYYFNQEGYCLMNTQTPDGYQVDENGAWIINGVIQTKSVPVINKILTSNNPGVSNCYIETSKNEAISYLLYTPENATENMPLIVVLHGHGQIEGIEGSDISAYKGNRHMAPILSEAKKLDSAYIIAPVLPAKYDNGNAKMWLKIEDDLIELIETEVRAKKIDRNKISVIGSSMGADAAIQIAQNHPELFSCLALSVPFHKNPIRKWDNAWAENLTTVPMWAFLEDDKEVINMATEMKQAVEAAGGNVRLEVIKGANHGDASKQISASVSSDKFGIMKWMISVSKAK